MTYRDDPDLTFLAECTDDDLAPLFEYLTKGKDGSARLTETLTVSDAHREHRTAHSKYWTRIAEELQRFGGNTLVNAPRGSGVVYRQVLVDVCGKMKVNFSAKATTAFIESQLLAKILTDSVERMSVADREELVRSLDLKTTNYTGEAVAALLQAGVQSSGFVAYQVAVIVANGVAKALMGRGLSLGANALLTRLVAVSTGPIGLAVTALWTLTDIAGPAYRVTIPATVQVAFLRATVEHRRTRG